MTKTAPEGGTVEVVPDLTEEEEALATAVEEALLREGLRWPSAWRLSDGIVDPETGCWVGLCRGMDLLFSTSEFATLVVALADENATAWLRSRYAVAFSVGVSVQGQAFVLHDCTITQMEVRHVNGRSPCASLTLRFGSYHVVG